MTEKQSKEWYIQHGIKESIYDYIKTMYERVCSIVKTRTNTSFWKKKDTISHKMMHSTR